MKIRVRWGKEFSINLSCLLHVWLVYSEKVWDPLSPTHPGRLCFQFYEHRPSCPTPPSLPHNDIPFVTPPQLANVGKSPVSPHGLGLVFRLHGVGSVRVSLYHVLLFSSLPTMRCCHSAVHSENPAGRPYNLLGGHESRVPLKRMWRQTGQVQTKSVYY